jgi:hypothetical protein
MGIAEMGQGRFFPGKPADSRVILHFARRQHSPRVMEYSSVDSINTSSNSVCTSCRCAVVVLLIIQQNHNGTTAQRIRIESNWRSSPGCCLAFVDKNQESSRNTQRIKNHARHQAVVRGARGAVVYDSALVTANAMITKTCRPWRSSRRCGSYSPTRCRTS